MLALPLERQGNILILPKGQIGVAEACSGIRSLTACLFAGSFMAAVFLEQWWKKGLLILVAVGVAVISNIFRSLFLTLWAYWHGAEALSVKVHDVTGYAVLGFTCVVLPGLVHGFKTHERKKPLVLRGTDGQHH